MLPPTLPIFPLPNVVLFPNVSLPLHILSPGTWTWWETR